MKRVSILLTSLLLSVSLGAMQPDRDQLRAYLQEEYDAALALELFRQEQVVFDQSDSYSDSDDYSGIDEEVESPRFHQLAHSNPSVGPVHSHIHKAISVDDACTICLEKLEGASNLMCVAPCDHHFHKTCIEEWYKGERSQCKSCPTCRAKIVQLVATPVVANAPIDVSEQERLDAQFAAQLQNELNAHGNTALMQAQMQADEALARQLQDDASEALARQLQAEAERDYAAYMQHQNAQTQLEQRRKEQEEKRRKEQQARPTQPRPVSKPASQPKQSVQPPVQKNHARQQAQAGRAIAPCVFQDLLALPGLTGSRLKIPGVYHVRSKAEVPERQDWSCAFHALYNMVKLERRICNKRIDDQLFITACRNLVSKKHLKRGAHADECSDVARRVGLTHVHNLFFEHGCSKVNLEHGTEKAFWQNVRRTFEQSRGPLCIHFDCDIESFSAREPGHHEPHAVLITVIKMADGAVAIYIFDNVNEDENHVSQAQIRAHVELIHSQLLG